MEGKIDALKLMREIRLRLAQKYAKSPHKQFSELEEKFGHLKKKPTRT